MKSYLVSKLTLRDILEVRPEIHEDTKPMKIEDVPWCTLRKIMALDSTARNTLLNTDLSGLDRDEEDDLFAIDKHENTQNVSSIHPLDVLCVLLHCSDNFLQQEIVSKMAMCQFSVPLLLPPEGDGSPCMFMLWAMRDIVKKWRSQCLADSKGFREENVVNISMPVISFVRLGKTKLSKSKILNKILNPSQQQYNCFIHDNVDGGNIERKISDGLVEICWYFPSKTSNIFPEPFAVTNLRGGLETNWDQFTFLAEVSSAMFIFIETIDEREFQLLSKCSQSETMFCMVFSPDSGKHIEKETQKLLGDLLPVLRIDRENVILKKRTDNDVTLTKKIQGRMKQILERTCKSISLKDLPGYFRGHSFVTDESTDECQKGKDHANKITREIKDVAEYKMATMKLQGDLWKQLSEIDKELCRMKNQGEQNAEMHKSHLLLQRNALHVKQYQQKISKGIGLFTQALTDLSPKERQYFLKWMKFNLDAISRDNLSKLQAIYKEKCDNLPHSKKDLRDLDQKISDSCLGVEHFLREMGQFYEAEWSTTNHTVIQQNMKTFAHLPRIAANFLLDGFPLELIDGDASNIPLQWITDVLTELDKRTGGQCRLRVITVLGVQSTGKSTLLNTMFGLQFPVASGRCTRGAFMTLLNVKKNFQEKLGCHFILVIDTEGLKAPELSSLEGSYGHDNELATLVVGLSDITIVNMAMENSIEMKDILQIVVHAFLRMEEIGKQPNCQFVHQNVSDVSAPGKTMRDRRKLLEQLNEMTKVAAKMEKKNEISAFTDVMKYDLNKDNWYIPGLWQGDPPMAPINLGYSSNVLQLKMYLFEVMEREKSINKPSSISEFITWIESLWRSVKHEKFIFSFRNSLVAKAYNKLSVQYSLWEWDFCKKMYNWVISTENDIRNQSGEISEFNKHELQNILLEEEAKMIVLLEKYFENSENANLIERHREEFKLIINSLRKKLERNALSKCHEAVSIQNGKIKIQNIRRKSQTLMERRITHLLQRHREKKQEVSEGEIQQEFELMWKKTLSDLQLEELERCNVDHSLLHLLKNDMSNKGPQINEALIKINDLHQQHAKQGVRFYIDDKKHFDHSIKSVLSNLISKQEHIMKVGDLAASIIQTSDEYINEKMSSSDDYNEMYSKELLYMINKMLNDKDVKKLNFNKQFELDIKLFIFGKASQAFQKLHDKFIHENDPKLCLEKLKEQYLSGFIHHGKDGTANRFCERCLKPAIMDYLFKHLGQKIVDEILGDPENITFSSRSCFQYTVLEELLEEMSFQKYAEYINSYESFVKQWISTRIINKYCISPPASETLQGHILTSINKEIKTVLKNERCLKSQTVSCFLENFCELLKKDLVMSQEEMKVITFYHTGNVEQFSSEIEHYLKEAQRQIQSEVRSIALSSVLYTVTVKPQDELFRKVVGCRKQCPFCKVPCEIGGEDHKIHAASMHRPLGLSHYEKNEDKSLIVDICSTRVVANCSFRNVDTEWNSYPCKEYSTIYPNWIIQPDASIESSDYWKYVFVQFNKNFADLYEAKPAELPEVWRHITKEQAVHSLKKEFNMSRSSTIEKANTFKSLLAQLKMKSYLVSKLTLRDILDIGPQIPENNKPQKIEDVPWCTLRKIMALDSTARNTLLNTDLSGLDKDEDDLFDIDKHEDTQNVSSIHPLDVLCVLLHCSDNFLQQDIVTKMAMCQFSVPLLLPPAGDGSSCIFMLWSMRDIVKKWRPQCLAYSKGFREENVVNISMPVISFVRLGKTKLSKSKILNQVLNRDQKHYNFFIHDNVDGGNIERKISEGLVEMSWYFPSDIFDVFPEPCAVSNLRGDLESNWDQFTFLAEVSSAMFIFIETIDEREFQLLSKCSQSDTKFYIVFTPNSGKHIEKKTQKLLGDLLPVLRIYNANVILKQRTENDAMLTNKIQEKMKKILESTSKYISLKDLPRYFSGHPFVTDESTDECQKGRNYADKITREIKDVAEYKMTTMKLQGHLWKQLSEIDKELCRMKNQGEKDAETHQCDLLLMRSALHAKQSEHKFPKGIELFTQALTDLSHKGRQYFLKWMKLNLDAIARDNLSKLQENYKGKCNNLAQNKKELRELDQKISDSCLGVEHFLREMGQFYEAECSIRKHTVIQQNMKKIVDLPRIAADLLLDGFPLELIDGDAGNIPLQWITNVLIELNRRTGGQCRLRVITVLGVQSTGKSTLLNTMFGLQFPVASGRCTRGAFMTLLNVKEDFQEKLGCQFILVIDTEGLKAPGLTFLQGSYEHYNELATFVVGLSDITIVNMAMDNSTEMKDVLQIVVHAFLRMKEIGRKPNCQFVHQNVSDVSANDQNMRHRKLLLEKLNDMTKVAAKMEKKYGISNFNDVMKYDLNKDNWYIPGLWQGDPPIAPVNLGYSSNVHELKMYLFQFMDAQKSKNNPLNISDFITWIESLWRSVKHEKFIFSFRNSLVAKAYNKLSVQYSSWEWDFCKTIHNWMISEENNIKNQSEDKCESNKEELQRILLEEENKMIASLEKYFENTENINLIERYREDFKISIQSLRKRLERNALSKCHEAVCIRKAKIKIQDIQKTSQTLIEERITNLLQSYRQNNNEVSEQKRQQEFNLMWQKTLSDLQFEELKRCNVDHSILLLLKNDMSSKGPHINEALIKVKSLSQNAKKSLTMDIRYVDRAYTSFPQKSIFVQQELYGKIGVLAESIVEMSDKYIKEKISSSGDYNEMYSKELLHQINTKLNSKDVKNLHFTSEFELDLKLFIFGKASQAFQKLHDKFIQENDPKLCLEKLKDQYLSTFLSTVYTRV